MLALSALALACVCAPAAGASTGIRPKIVNGAPASITEYPFQALLYVTGGDPATSVDRPGGDRFCGGVVRDPTHVITAAHCVFDVFNPLEVSNPGDVTVLAGTDDLTSLSSPAQNVVGSQIAFDPLYDPSTNTHDVAVITLPASSPLWDPPGSPPTNIQPISPISSSAWSALTAGAPLVVTGFGDMSEEPADGSGTASFSNTLQKATVPLVDPTACSDEYGSAGVPVDTTLLFCAGDGTAPITDSCQGDSGGPIVSGSPGSFVLVGLVDSGIGCAQRGFPGIYTQMVNGGEPETFAFSDHSPAPSRITVPTLSGGNAAGQTLTCSGGDWTNSPTLTYQFFQTGSNAPLTAPTATNTYTVQQADVGSRIQCEVEAKNDGGFGFGESNTVLIPVPPQPPPPPPATKDTTAPKLRLTHKSCTKTTCTLKLTVTDAAPSSGLAKPKATLSFTRTVKCRKTSAARRCKKTVRRSLQVTGGTGGKFTVVAKHLTPNTGYKIALVPFDKAGNRPQFSTITNVRTKPRHQRLL